MIAQAYVAGVSTRRVEGLVQTLGIERLSKSRPDIVAQGSAAFDVKKYTADKFVPGDVVGWLLTDEVDEQGMVGRRLF